MLVAREFNKDDKKQLLDMIVEIKNFDNNFEGLTNISNISDYNAFLTDLKIRKIDDLNINPHTPQTVYGVFENDKLIGGFKIRHIIKAKHRDFAGHIGYLVRPSKRGLGYGNEILKLALNEASKYGRENVFITSDEKNIASIRIIEKCGAKFNNDYYDKISRRKYLRYYIELKDIKNS